MKSSAGERDSAFDIGKNFRAPQFLRIEEHEFCTT
jgi:hypothetical protein